MNYTGYKSQSLDFMVYADGSDGISVSSVIQKYALAPETEDGEPVTSITAEGGTWNIAWTASPPAYVDYPKVNSIAITSKGKNVYWEKQVTTYSSGDVNEGAPSKSTMLDVDFINALGITAKKITVLQDNTTGESDDNRIIFEADGFNETGAVKIGGFVVDTNSLQSEGPKFLPNTTAAQITAIFKVYDSLGNEEHISYSNNTAGAEIFSNSVSNSGFYNPSELPVEVYSTISDPALLEMVQSAPTIWSAFTDNGVDHRQVLVYSKNITTDLDGDAKDETYNVWDKLYYKNGEWVLDWDKIWTNVIVYPDVYLGTDKIELVSGDNCFRAKDGEIFANAGSIGGWEIGDFTLRSVSSNEDNTLTLCSIPDATPINFPGITTTQGNWQSAGTNRVTGAFPAVNRVVNMGTATITGSYVYSATASTNIKLQEVPEYCIAYCNGTSTELGPTPQIILEEGTQSKVFRSAKLNGNILTLTTTAQKSFDTVQDGGVEVTASAHRLGNGAINIINIEATYPPLWRIQVGEIITFEELGFDDTDTLYIKNNDDVIELTENAVPVDSGNDGVTLSIKRIDTGLNLITSYEGATKINYTSPTYSVASVENAFETAVLWVGSSDSTKAPFKILGDGTIQAFKGAIRFNSAGTATSIIPGWSTDDTNDCCLNYNNCEFNSSSTTKTWLMEYTSKFKGQLGTDVNNYATSDGTVSKIDGLSIASSFTSASTSSSNPLYCDYSQVTSNGITLGSRVPGIDGSGDYNYCTLKFASGDAILTEAEATITANNSDLVIEAKDKIGRLAGTWTTDTATSIDSDQNLKHSIEPLTENYSVLFDNLRPVRFKYNNGTSDRYHTGFIAQEVEQAIVSSGLTTNDVAGYIKKADIVNDNGTLTKEGTRGIRYGEFVALNTDQIQKLKTRVAELEATVAELTKLVNEKLNLN